MLLAFLQVLFAAIYMAGGVYMGIKLVDGNKGWKNNALYILVFVFWWVIVVYLAIYSLLMQRKR